jgi:hypothetical protein
MKTKASSTILILLSIVLLGISACKKDTTPTTSNVTYSLPIGNVTDYIYSSGTYTYTYDVTNADLMQAYSTLGIAYDLSKLNSAKLTSLIAVSKNGYDLNGISAINVYIKLNGASGNGVRIAHATNSSTTATSLTLTPDNPELKSFIVAPNSIITVEYETTESYKYYSFDLNQGNVAAVIQK